MQADTYQRFRTENIHFRHSRICVNHNKFQVLDQICKNIFLVLVLHICRNSMFSSSPPNSTTSGKWVFITYVSKGNILRNVRVWGGIKEALKQLPECHTTQEKNQKRTQLNKKRLNTARIRNPEKTQRVRKYEKIVEARHPGNREIMKTTETDGRSSRKPKGSRSGKAV